MANQRVHLFKNRLERNSNLYLLLIPTIVFILVLSVFLAVAKKTQLASFNHPAVLGDETSPIDNQTTFEGEY